MVKPPGRESGRDPQEGRRFVGSMFDDQVRRDLRNYSIICYGIALAIAIFGLFDTEGDLVGALLFAGFVCGFGLLFTLGWWFVRRKQQKR